MEGSGVLWACAVAPVIVPVQVELSAKVHDTHQREQSLFSGLVCCVFTCIRTLREYCVRINHYDREGKVLASGAAKLPVGSYFNHVDGNLVHVSRPVRGKVEWVKLYFGDSERRVLRQHDAAIDRAVRTLQSTRSHVRRAKARKSLNMLGMGIRCRIQLKRMLKRARARLLPIQVARIQAMARMYSKAKAWRLLRRRLVLLQALWRGAVLRERRRHARATFVMIKFRNKIMSKIRLRRLRKQRAAVILLQSVWRMKASVMKSAMMRKMRAVNNTSLLCFKLRLKMKVIRRRRAKEAALKVEMMESDERDLMDAEETWMRRHMVAAAEKRRIDAERDKRVYAEMLRQEQMRKAAIEHKNRY